MIRDLDHDDRTATINTVTKTDYDLSNAHPKTTLAEFASAAKAEHRIEECLRRAYDSDAIRERIRQAKGKACIRPNPTRKVKKRYDRKRYRNRNVIERFFGAIKRFRRVATRYEKKAVNHLGFAWLAAILVNLK